MEDFPAKYPVAFQALTEDSYVDNTFLTAPDHETINTAIEEVNLVAEKGGFKYKEWIISGKPIPHQNILVKLPNQISTEVA